MNTATALAVALVVLAAVLSACFAGIAWVIKRQIGDNDGFREQLGTISTNLQVLNAGASLGARSAIAELRRHFESRIAENRIDLIDVREDLEKLEGRHNDLTTAVEVLADRVNRNTRTLAPQRAQKPGGTP